MSACHVVRLADLNAGHDLGTGHARGSLRYCINVANNNPGPDTIDFSVTGTIKLTGGLPSLTSDITMTGPGADQLAVDGDGEAVFAGPIFNISGATVSISGVTITNGYGDTTAGGILNHGTLVLQDCTVANNRYYLSTDGGNGAGIANAGNLTISGSTISGNSFFLANDANGAGISNYTPSAVLLIENSTISGNYFFAASGTYGGGIFNNGTLDIRFSTITNNRLEYLDPFGGSGVHNAGGTVHLYNTIVAGNANGPDVAGSYTGSSNLIGGDPMLGHLKYNGGHTQTHAVLPGSPAIDAGDNTGAPEWDQRGPGFPRIVNGTVDIGAFEVQATGVRAMSRHVQPSQTDVLMWILATADLDSLA